MSSGLLSAKYPELVFAIAGPIGIDIEAITRTLSDVLMAVAYRSALIKITDEIRDIQSSVEQPANQTYYNLMRYKMAHANQICRDRKDPAFLMKLAVRAIADCRVSFLETPNHLRTLDDDVRSVVSDVDEDDLRPFYLGSEQELLYAGRSAYIIRQIKRPDEVVLLRQVYGKQFVLISAYGSEADRLNILRDRIRTDSRGSVKPSRELYLASKLIELDAEESADSFGQHTRDAFHLADVVIDGINKATMKSNIERFVNALFGSNEIAPTKVEFGMAAAQAAALRSSDLSRQVGAALFSTDGALLVQGCNEVPKAFGGTYWDGETPDHRDIKIGRDSNDVLKIDVLTDLVDRLKRNGLLSTKVARSGSTSQIVNVLIGRVKGSDEFSKANGSLKNSKILDLTEYGRVVHAEMNAICDAARTGVSLKSSRLFTTTFPCHNCTKHILASGISEVIFLEPYPKSKAKELHYNEIEIEGCSDDKVNFRPFLGVTPFRYRDIFTKSKRKKDGQAVQWQHGSPAPMVDVSTDEPLRLEGFIISLLSSANTYHGSPVEAQEEEAKAPTSGDTTGGYDADGP